MYRIFVEVRTITYEYLEKIKKLFEDKGWDWKSELYDRFCNRMDVWNNDEERDFFLELSERFLWVRLEEYTMCIEYVLEKILSREINDQQKNVCLLPLKLISELKHEKSGDIVAYILRGGECSNIFSKYKKHKDIFSSIVFCLNRVSSSSDKIVLIDDFIGSGDTAIAVIDELVASKRILIEQIVVAVIVIMEEAYERLVDKGVRVVSWRKASKGIHGFYAGDELNKKLCMIKSMTEIIKGKKSFSSPLGYSCTEALVSMYRTPNNTLPIFWAKKGKAKEGEGPFLR